METKRQNDTRELMPLKLLRTVLVAFAVGAVCMGCSGGSQLRPKINGEPGISNVPYGEDAHTNRPPVLAVGSKFVYQGTSLSSGKPIKVTMEVAEKKEFDHKEAYWVGVTGDKMTYFNIYDMNLNWVGTFGEGRELESAEPCLQIFRWPLKVREKWRSKYILRDYSDHSGGVQIQPSRVDVITQSYEEIKVPAGTFKAFRIQAGGETFWYAPSIGWIVKEELGAGTQKQRILELVEYHIPQNT